MFDDHAKMVLHEAIKALFPVHVRPETLIRRHAWATSKYVGEFDGKVLVWQGWSANLSTLDIRYRTVYIDFVLKRMTDGKNKALFGPYFADKISGYSEFVVLFMTNFIPDDCDTLIKEGFIPRLTRKKVHACVLVEPDEFLSMSAHHWASHVVRLVMLQHLLSQKHGGG
jgi:hypothetical protein